MVPHKWDDSVYARLTKALDQGVTESAAHLVGQLKQNLSGIEGGGPIITRVSPMTGRRYWTGRGAPPGRFPYYRSGRLRQSATQNPARAIQQHITVGVSTPYARYVEFGTRRMAARPYLRRTLAQESPRIVQIIRNRALVELRFGGGVRV